MIKVEQINNIYIASFDGVERFNSLVTEPAKEQLNALFTKPDTNLIINLKGIKYIDSSGFGAFLSVMKTASINYGHFKLCNMSKEVLDLFRLLQLHNVFEIYDTEEECIKSFSKK
jgi:anti-sigma B factor antagonist